MITLRRSEQRRHRQRGARECWRSFNMRERDGPLAGGVGALRVLDENLLAPGAEMILRPLRDVQIVTYVLEGELVHEDSRGLRGVIGAGEFQCLSAQRRGRYGQTNVSRATPAHVFHLWLLPPQLELEPSCASKRFSAADRRGVLCVVVAGDGRRAALRIHNDVVLYSALLDPGQHVVHELGVGRAAWLQIVRGRTRLGDVILSAGDGAGIQSQPAVSLTAHEDTELLLLDLTATAREPVVP